MAQESLLNTNWNNGDVIAPSELNTHGQAHLDLDGHGDALHSVQYVKALTGGDGIDPSSIGDGDTVSVAWGDANDLDADGNVTSSGGISSLTGGIGILPATIGDGDTLDVDLSAIAGQNLTVDTTNNELDASGASGITSLSGGDGISPASIGDGDTLAVAWADASALGAAGGLLTDSLTVAGNSVALGGSTGISHGDLSSAPTNAHHQEPTAGTGITDEGTNAFAISVGGVKDTQLGVDPFVYDPGMTEFEAGLSDEEINRIVLQSGESLEVERIEFRQKGGGSSSSVSVDVRDVDRSSTVGSQTLGGTTKDPGEAGPGSTVLIRVTNSTGSSITAAPRVQGYITGVVSSFLDFSGFDQSFPYSPSIADGSITFDTVNSTAFSNAPGLTIDQDASTGGNEQLFAVTKDIDVTGKSALECVTDFTRDGSFDSLQIKLGGQTLYDSASAHSFTQRSFDISGLSGTQTLAIGHIVSGGNTREPKSIVTELELV